LLVVAFAGAWVAWRRMRLAPARVDADDTDRARRLGTARGRWIGFALAMLIASLALRGAMAAREIWLRPLYPWDAWSAWAVKAKTWLLLGHYVPYVSMHDWMLQAPAANLYTGVAWHYPDGLAWIEVWFASAAGGWIEPLINLPWLGVWLGLLCGHYGQWRALGLSPRRALFGIYLLGSLPLLLVHAALAGYADIWVAAVFGFGVLAWMRWMRFAESGQLLLALGCAAALPTLKLEGLVWAACLLIAIGFGFAAPRWRLRLGLSGLLAFLVLILFGGLRFLCLRAGWVDASGAVSVPGIGPLAMVLNLSWHGAGAGGIVTTLFAQPNWHLLWWLAPFVLWWRRRDLAAHAWLGLPTALLLVCCGLLLFLFLATDAASWAQSFTAINRLTLHLAPALVSVLMLSLRDASWPALIAADGRGSRARTG
jgi:hypothetical protein